jgi:hypothetical protein
MSSYLHAHPGFPQRIGNHIFTVKYMFSDKNDAHKMVARIRKEGKYEEVRYYPRAINGRLFGRHPHCVVVRGLKRRKK